MSEEIGGVIWAGGILAFAIFLLFGSYQKGRVAGQCMVRAEYALTATDTLTVARAHPECASLLFTEAM